jgi:hypothetical protein
MAARWRSPPRPSRSSPSCSRTTGGWSKRKSSSTGCGASRRWKTRRLPGTSRPCAAPSTNVPTSTSISSPCPGTATSSWPRPAMSRIHGKPARRSRARPRKGRQARSGRRAPRRSRRRAEARLRSGTPRRPSRRFPRQRSRSRPRWRRRPHLRARAGAAALAARGSAGDPAVAGLQPVGAVIRSVARPDHQPVRVALLPRPALDRVRGGREDRRTSTHLFLPITETAGELWRLEGVDR